MKVLIIDDNPSFHRIFQFYTENLLDVDFIGIESGLEGLKILEKDKNSEISLIVSDIRMPTMSGVEFLKIAKKKYPNTPVMLMTGLDINSLHIEDLKDAIEVINKDVGFEGIISKIKNFLNLQYRT